MDPAVLSAIVIALGSMAVAVVTSRQNRSGARATNALTERVVDRDDFKEVMDRMKEDVQQSNDRLVKVEKRLEEEVEARKEADTRAHEAEQRAIAAEKRAERLEHRVSQLEQALRDHDIPVPPNLDKL